jgi:phosphoribosylformylglycinamidine synthase
VYPTPVIGMVGVLDDVSRATGSHFRNAGDTIVLLGEPTAEIGASEYLIAIRGEVAGAPPACDLARERALIEALVEGISTGVIGSAHDTSDGGLAVALAECAIGDDENHFGMDVDLSAWKHLPLRALLFGEAQSRAVVTTQHADAVLDVARKYLVPARVIGTVRAASDGITMRTGTRDVLTSTDACARAYHDAIPARMRVPAAVGAPA